MVSMLFCCMFVESAYGVFISGNILFKDLESDVRGGAGYSEGHSSGYITGVADSFDRIAFCIPDGVSIRQIKHVVYNHMKNNPVDWDKSADLNVIKAMKSTWPCKNI